MKKDVRIEGLMITICPKAEDAAARVAAAPLKLAKGAALTDAERDALLVAIAQALGIV